MEVGPCNVLHKPSGIPPDASNICTTFCNNTIAVGHEGGGYLTDLNNNTVSPFQDIEDDVSAIKFKTNDNNVIYLACGSNIKCFDIRQSLKIPTNSFSDNQDEINCIDLNQEDSLLAACDDSGDCVVFDLKTNKLMRTLRRRHTNICSSVRFLPGRSDEVVTGGLDSQAIRWDFRRYVFVQSFVFMSL